VEMSKHEEKLRLLSEWIDIRIAHGKGRVEELLADITNMVQRIETYLKAGREQTAYLRTKELAAMVLDLVAYMQGYYMLKRLRKENEV